MFIFIFLVFVDFLNLIFVFKLDQMLTVLVLSSLIHFTNAVQDMFTHAFVMFTHACEMDPFSIIILDYGCMY